MTNPKQDIAAVQLSLLPMRDLWKSADSNMRKLKESHRLDLWEWRQDHDGSVTARGKYWKHKNKALEHLQSAIRLSRVLPKTTTVELDYTSACHGHYWKNADARRAVLFDRAEVLP